MEFHEKLQELRKSKGLTQEELAEALFVSRTAISKWESGRGYPNIDSPKAISKYFSVSLDDLLSSDEILTIAEEDNRQTEQHFRDLVFGLLDCSVAVFLFLPFFGEQGDGIIRSVSLLALTQIAPYVKIPYMVFVFSIILWGILTLALQNCKSPLWSKYHIKISLGLSAIGTILFIVSQQPYAAVFLLIFLIIKALMLIKWA